MSSIFNTTSSNPLDLSLNPAFKLTKTPSENAGGLWAAASESANSRSKGVDRVADAVAKASTNTEKAKSARDQAQEAAEGLVSTTFIEPILKQVRESNDTPPPFGPSRAEKQFNSILDTKLADEIVKSSNFGLVQRITEQLLKNMPQQVQQQLDISG